MPQPTIRRATPDDYSTLSSLLEHYYEEWGIWQRDSPASLRAALSEGQLGYYLAEREQGPLGCILCRPYPGIAAAAECKRLFVLPAARGSGLARLLIERIESDALGAGFAWMYLDSKDEFTAALALYRRCGYLACDRYNDNPQATQFFRKNLRATPFAPLL